jgi:hypothetical protein
VRVTQKRLVRYFWKQEYPLLSLLMHHSKFLMKLRGTLAFNSFDLFSQVKHTNRALIELRLTSQPTETTWITTHAVVLIHKKGCKWVKFWMTNGEEAAHERHMSTCKCGHANLHKYGGFGKSCMFTEEFLEEFVEDGDRHEERVNEKAYVSLCCCSPEMPHDEARKFILLSKSEEVLNNRPFTYLKDGVLSIIDKLPEENAPLTAGNFVNVGRSKLLFEIVSSL